LKEENLKKMHIGMFETRAGFGGGNIYQRTVEKALSQNFNFSKFPVSPKIFPKVRRPRMLAKIMRINRKEKQIDLWIRNFLAVVGMNGLSRESRNIALFFHIDYDQIPNKWLSQILDSQFWKNIERCDRIVVIAKYWENYLKSRGVENIKVIYHGLDLSAFIFVKNEIDEFKKFNGLTGKPIIYLGNCQESKGVREAYNSLKDYPYHLVTSGKKEVDIPARHLELTYRDYLRLLKSSSVVLTMSKFLEGWNITAHEAMLCQTPVIGSGTGGMKELLEGGRQIVCHDFRDLPELVENAMQKAERYGISGYGFAKEFNFERFQTEWIGLIRSLESSQELVQNHEVP
jgi:glycosyltransferase involved in cell wall biosynthesis